MSDPRTRAAAGEFSELWSSVSKHYKPPGTAVSPCRTDLQSPRSRGDSRCFGFINGDSPGDTEVSQDIFWDSTSPTGLGKRNTRVVEISEIVNRIAPKNITPKEKESSLLQWIDDGIIPYTPEIQKSRVRKRSSRQSSVEDLMKLARQFDKNMQQDEEASQHLNIVNNNLCEPVKTSEAKLTDAAFSSDGKGLDCPSPSEQVEAELNALFDCSTQGVSGRLSEGSVFSQEIKDRTGNSASAENQIKELNTCSNTTNNGNDYDDDWENDDLLNDSFVLEATQNPDVHLSDSLKTTSPSKNKANTTQFTSVFKQSTNTDSSLQLSDPHSKTRCSTLQELCPKPKTTNRSTFKLAPNPHLQPKMTEEVSKPGFTVIQPKSKMSATTKPCSKSQDRKETGSQAASYLKPPFVKDVSNSSWDDGDDDDALLYQVCDRVEKISNSQPRQTSSSNYHENHNFATGRQQPLDNRDASAKRQPSHAFVRCNSLPETSCETGNYKGWNIPMKGSNNKSRMSQSFPGSRVDLATFGQCRDSSGNVQAGDSNVEGKVHTVVASAPQKSHLSTFKRNLSDSAIISNKVFVTSQKTGKCSAAEIERKKQEALARRRLRMQSSSKPS
ncbi:ewing's tumor-associated antigen 1 homolog [Cololabis saira]|uniref:ewing's tumor-associated antigen 1 homolog n=1 Tax=Cololabis saira TaxID=129043 RepID=UPI002AD2377A|nr:ewing's tumor-associated antigen 1 homolog [Cololabis saira]